MIGQPIGHSVSPLLHREIARQLGMDIHYRGIEVAPAQVENFLARLRKGDFCGINVTIPHKATVTTLVDKLDSQTQAISAVNCVARRDNSLVGHNTDVSGFLWMIQHHHIVIPGQHFLLFGAGGSARAVVAALATNAAATITMINRSSVGVEECRKVVARSGSMTRIITGSEDVFDNRYYAAVINTTPLGMYPDTLSSPVNNDQAARLFNNTDVVIDLVYNPPLTRFLKQAQNAHAKLINGVEMLVAQAVYSHQIWGDEIIFNCLDTHALINVVQDHLQT